MDHKLCKRLKDAGFPLDNPHWFWASNRAGDPPELVCGELLDEYGWSGELVAAPSLSELIAACGEGFGALLKNPEGKFLATWAADVYTYPYEGFGKKMCATPEEAVAELWLQLHANG
jgi:hypothetical protein